MLQTIGAIIQLIVLIFSKWGERDAEKKAEKAQLQKELTNAIASKDTSAITSVLDRLR